MLMLMLFFYLTRGHFTDVTFPFFLLETSQRIGGQADAMHSTLHPMHQTERNEESS